MKVLTRTAGSICGWPLGFFTKQKHHQVEIKSRSPTDPSPVCTRCADPQPASHDSLQILRLYKNTDSLWKEDIYLCSVYQNHALSIDYCFHTELIRIIPYHPTDPSQKPVCIFAFSKNDGLVCLNTNTLV